MPWFKVDDTLHSHPKARNAGLEAVGLWTLSGSFSMAYKGDGDVPAYFVDGFKRQGSRAADLLVRNGLWIESADGYQFHDWHDFQPSSDEIERDRELARERQRRSREKRRTAQEDQVREP